MVKEKNRLKMYLNKIKNHYKARVVLFGSRARGDFFNESDVDILIISDKFRDMNMIKRMEDVQMYWNGDSLLESFCYTPEEFDKFKDRIGIIKKAIEEGIEV